MKKRKEIIATILLLTMLSLTACQENALPATSRADANGTTGEETGLSEKDEGNLGYTIKETSDKADAFPSYGSVDESGKATDDPAGSSNISEEDVEQRIETIGKMYDGYESSWENPTVDSILLENGEFFDVSERDLLKQCETNSEKKAIEEYVELIGQLKSFFNEIKVYKPKDGYTIAIANKKLYEYRISDTDAILDVYMKISNLSNNLPYLYGYDDEDISLFKSITNAIGITGGRNYSKGAIAESAVAMNDDIGLAAEATEEYNAADSYEISEDMPTPEPSGTIYPYDEPEWNTEEYKNFTENRFMSTQTSPFSTFGMDVDTASYSNFRKKIFNGENIPVDSIRTEEMMNYFSYDYKKPENGEKFGVSLELADTPWNEDTQLLKIGVKSEEADTENIRSNVVFLIDTSGSMFDPDKLPLVQKSFLMLLDGLNKDDKVSIVTYAGSDEIVCKGVSCDKKEELTKKIISLEAWGGTNGAAGIKTAYDLARKNFIKGGNNRVILATDGDLNLGITSESDLVDLITEEKESGVFLSVLGVGQGNYKDSKMKALADNGNGNFAYIDSTSAADKALSKDFDSLMYTVAKDSKMQVEFNPAKVKGYRQIGYELRRLNTEDFADDTKDGAEIGSGQCVTILYEIVPAKSDMDIPGVESKYNNTSAGNSSTDELLTVSIRYKQPENSESELIEIPVTVEYYRPEMSNDMSWAAGVAQTAMILRNSEFKGTSSYDEVYERLKKNSSIMSDDIKAQFLYMVKLLDDTNLSITEEDDDYYGW